MQMGFFYVRLRPDIDPKEQWYTVGGKAVFLSEVFTKTKAYPVLAVDYRTENGVKETLYHIPTESNEIGWFPSEFFLFARD